MNGKQLADKILRDPKNIHKEVYIRYGRSDLLKVVNVVKCPTYMVIVVEDQE